MSEQQFDVFLVHNSKDKTLIRQIYRQLKGRDIRPWLDEEEIAPGTQFQDEIQQAISQIKTAAICIGSNDLGRWQALELKTFISQCVERGIPVIPVLLPGVASIPRSLLFLKEFHAVQFISGIDDEHALFHLEWGITGRKPAELADASVNSAIERHFPKAPTTSQTFSIPDAADWQLPELPKSQIKDNLASNRGVGQPRDEGIGKSVLASPVQGADNQIISSWIKDVMLFVLCLGASTAFVFGVYKIVSHYYGVSLPEPNLNINLQD